MQQRHQREFDRNLDIFDRYVKKNLKAVMPDRKRPNAGAASGKEVKPRGDVKAGVPEAGGRKAAAAADEGRSKGTRGDEGDDKAWEFEVDEKAPPKRVEDERRLDAELQRLRVRQREVRTANHDHASEVPFHRTVDPPDYGVP